MPVPPYETVLLVERLRGTLPVLLACGHDGIERPDGVPRRTGRGLPAACRFHAARDRKVADLTRALAEGIRARTGEWAYVVIAAFHRKYVDANRPPGCAFETDAARPYFEAYHGALRSFVDEIRAENGGVGLLLDLHGSKRRADAPADIYVGTEDGLTITALRQRMRGDALYRRRGLAGLLRAAGYALLPDRAGIPEHPSFKGGYTVETYGSHHADGIDAIQLEIAAELRMRAARRATLAVDLADAVASVLPRWLAAPATAPVP